MALFVLELLELEVFWILLFPGLFAFDGHLIFTVPTFKLLLRSMLVDCKSKSSFCTVSRIPWRDISDIVLIRII